MKKIIITFFVFTLLLSSIYIFNSNQAQLVIKTYLDLDTKIFLKKYFRANSNQDKKIKLNTDKMNELSTKISIMEHKLADADLKYQIDKEGFYFDTKQKEISLNKDIKLDIWKIPFYSWNINEKMTSYIESAHDNYYMTTGSGYFYKGFLNDIESGELKIYPLKTNIEEVIDTKMLRQIYFKSSSYSHAISIKDTLIHDDYFYVSLVDSIKENCYMTSVLRAKFSKETKFLNFEYFFKPSFCLENKDNTALIISGGALEVNPYNNNLYLSIGDYRHWDKASKKNNVLGKILEIDLNSKEYSILSSGHRNPLGIYFDETSEILFSSEMGPHYGDEINLLERNENYGWPVSSYGLHYGDYKGDHPLANLVELAPLHKSHKDYSYKEPLFSFSPYFDRQNIMLEKLEGGPALKNIEKNILDHSEDTFMVFGMKSMKIYKFEFLQGSLELNETIDFGFRVRDVKTLKNYYLLTEEKGPSLIMLKK